MPRKNEIKQLLFEHNRHLQKLKEIQAKKGLDTEPYILLEIEDKEAEIEKLKTELTALEEAEKTESSLSRFERLRRRFSQLPRLMRWLTPVALMLAVGAGVWIMLDPGTPPTSPELPEVCLPSPKPVQVAVAQLPNCPPDRQLKLIKRWANNSTAVVAPLEQAFETSAASRAHIDKTDYNLVVWGACDQPETVENTLHYELLTTRKPAEIYEPQQVTLTGTVESQIEAGLALISYQHGDYTEAANHFNQLSITKTVPEMAMLWANSLLFAGQYDSAIAAYQDIIMPLKPDWAAVFNNLGMAQFNKVLMRMEGVPQAGYESLERAIELAEKQGDTDLAVMAHVNNSFLLIQAKNFNDAKTNCDAAMTLNAHSAYPYICRASYNFARGFAGDEMKLNQIKEDLDQAAQFDDVPPKLLYLRGFWYFEQGQKSETLKNHSQFVAAMKNRACLYNDREWSEKANSFVNGLSR